MGYDEAALAARLNKGKRYHVHGIFTYSWWKDMHACVLLNGCAGEAADLDSGQATGALPGTWQALFFWHLRAGEQLRHRVGCSKQGASPSCS